MALPYGMGNGVGFDCSNHRGNVMYKLKTVLAGIGVALFCYLVIVVLALISM